MNPALPSNNLVDLLPLLDATAKNVCFLTGDGDGWLNRLAWNPSDELMIKNSNNFKTQLTAFAAHNQGKLIIGFLSYDAGYTLQGVARTKPDDLNLPDVYLLAFENYLEETDGQIKVVSKNDSFLRFNATTISDNAPKPPFQTTLKRQLYDESFEKIISYIKAGHIYQINYAHRLETNAEVNPRQAFKKLLGGSTGSMMGYLEGPNFELMSFSPERFIKINDRHITTTPIKGTRALDIDSEEAKTRLLNDPKEKSELNMITDLLRNDLAKVSRPGSVKLTDQRSTQVLSRVVHTYSRITAELKDNVSPLEALLSMFPGGSITGCPKKRAMEIIDEVEPFSRSAYCGSMLCLTPDGNLDSNILIRTIIKKDDRLVLPVGGGIVFDSDKNREYQETLDKAAAIIDAWY